MAFNLAPVIKQRYFDANGNPLAGGKLYTYQSGTTTPQVTYTSQSGGTPNANPVVLDANGEANIWLDVSLVYKFILADSTGAPIWTVDNVSGTHSLVDGSVNTATLVDDSVTAAKLKDSAGTDADRAVTTNHIRDSAITAAKLADDSVTAAKFKSDASVDANRPVTTDHIRDAAVTPAKRSALGQQIGSQIAFSTSSSSFVDVTNASVSITTTGRPVFIGLIPGTDAIGGNIAATEAAGQNATAIIQILRDATVIGIIRSGGSASGATTFNHQVPCGAVYHIDTPAAGQYVYKLQIKLSSGSSVAVNYAKLIAYEL